MPWGVKGLPPARAVKREAMSQDADTSRNADATHGTANADATHNAANAGTAQGAGVADTADLARQVFDAVRPAIGAYGTGALVREETPHAPEDVDRGRRMLQEIYWRDKNVPPLETAVNDFAAGPRDEDAAASLRVEIKKVLASDETLAQEMVRMLRGESEGINAEADRERPGLRGRCGPAPGAGQVDGQGDDGEHRRRPRQFQDPGHARRHVGQRERGAGRVRELTQLQQGRQTRGVHEADPRAVDDDAGPGFQRGGDALGQPSAGGQVDVPADGDDDRVGGLADLTGEPVHVGVPLLPGGRRSRRLSGVRLPFITTPRSVALSI